MVCEVDVFLASQRPTVIAAAAHLSGEARGFLADPPAMGQMDYRDRAVAAAVRMAIGGETESLLAQIASPWSARSETAGGIDVTWFNPDPVSDSAIIHLHGGGYVMGTPMTGASIPIGLAQSSGLPVASIDYRLAPENPFPAALDDVVAACVAIGAEYEIAGLVGESAGGGLATAATALLRDSAHQIPKRLGLLSPWIDLTTSGDSYQTLLKADPVFNDVDSWASAAEAYAQSDLSNPLVSPLFADLAEFPPTLIQVGSREILLSDACRLAAALRGHGVDTILDVWDGLWHVWQLEPNIPEASQALAEVASFITGGSLWPA